MPPGKRVIPTASRATPGEKSPPAQPGSGGPGPGGTASPSVVSGTGAYTVSGGIAHKARGTVSAASTDESGVLAKVSSRLELTDVKVSTTDNSSSSDDSSFYGLDAGVLAFSRSAIKESGGSVTTTGNGANAVFAYGSGSSIAIDRTKVTATGQYAHGIMASGGGSIKATDLEVTTAGASSAAVATDRGGGTITVIGGPTGPRATTPRASIRPGP
jgi:hypothetical protein